PSSSTSIHPPCHVGGYDDRTPPPRVRRPHPPPTPSPGARRDPPGSELVPGCRTRTVHAPSSARRYEFAGDARGWGVGPSPHAAPRAPRPRAPAPPRPRAPGSELVPAYRTRTVHATSSVTSYELVGSVRDAAPVAGSAGQGRGAPRGDGERPRWGRSGPRS